MAVKVYAFLPQRVHHRRLDWQVLARSIDALGT